MPERNTSGPLSSADRSRNRSGRSPWSVAQAASWRLASELCRRHPQLRLRQGVVDGLADDDWLTVVPQRRKDSDGPPPDPQPGRHPARAVGVEE
ncbi:hypothetical protein [Georgenia thermotolerans]|uniref:TY-Chap2 family putative peptide chaperone n=1 Tax=Georgenia thermotolerans TaxID=527326 RepID=UPI0038602330